MKLNTRYFANFEYDTKNGTDFTVDLTLNGRTHPCWLYLLETMSDTEIKQGAALLDQLEELDQVARKAFMQHYLEGSDSETHNTVVDFIRDHFQDYGDETTEEIATKLGTPNHDGKLFIANLDLGHVSLSRHANDDTNVQLVLDYSLIWLGDKGEIPNSFTDQLLVAKFDQNGELLYIAHES